MSRRAHTTWRERSAWWEVAEHRAREMTDGLRLALNYALTGRGTMAALSSGWMDDADCVRFADKVTALDLVRGYVAEGDSEWQATAKAAARLGLAPDTLWTGLHPRST